MNKVSTIETPINKVIKTLHKPSQLKHVLIEVGVDFKTTVLEQLLAKLVVCSKDKAQEDGTEFVQI